MADLAPAARCPHSLRSDAGACSQCLGVSVARIRPRDDAEAFAAALDELRPRRGRPRMHVMPLRKRLPPRSTAPASKRTPQLGPDELLGGDVARELGVSRQRVSQLATQLNAQRRGRVIVFSRSALDAHIAAQAERAKTDGRCRSRRATAHEARS